MEYLKFVPYSLLVLYGIKGLFMPLSWENVAIIAALGLVAFLCEKFIQTTEIVKCITKINEQTRVISEMQRDVETTKAYVTSMKLNGISGIKPNGFNRTAQQ